jgi:hypothetical protein
VTYSTKVDFLAAADRDNKRQAKVSEREKKKGRKINHIDLQREKETKTQKTQKELRRRRKIAGKKAFNDIWIV